MKFKVLVKDPDVFIDALKEAVVKEVKPLNLPEDEEESIIELRLKKYDDLMETWIEYGEYITLEFDLEKMTAVVVPRTS